jgi:hypothetical protein
MVRRAQNRREHALRGVPLLSDAEIDLEELERRVEEQTRQRGLRVRAEAGDPDAVAGLVEEAVRYERLIESAQETARARALARGLPYGERAGR